MAGSRPRHSAICAEAEKFGPYFTEGYWDYRDYDLENTRYVLCWGADPLCSNRQVPHAISIWKKVRDQATIAVVDPRFSATPEALKKQGIEDFQLYYALKTVARLGGAAQVAAATKAPVK